MKKKGLIRKTAYTLATTLVLGLFSSVSGVVANAAIPASEGTIGAATDTSNLIPPSTLGVQKEATYATKDDLMHIFNMDYGNQDVLGKIAFGINDMEWYVAGKDSGMSGDNTVLFMVNSLDVGKITFEDDKENNKVYSANWGCVYESVAPTEVYPNHYGASDIRAYLKSIEADGNTTYFTVAEKNLMNTTKVTTYDYKNASNYYTYDKLYLLSGGDSNSIIWAGTNSDIEVYDRYWGKSYFWLRPSNSTGSNDVYVYSTYYNPYEVGLTGVSIKKYVRPATNLDLTNVLFTSSVPVNIGIASSSIIVAETAMKIRMDGKSEIASEVFVDGNNIKLYPAANETTSLVVQGNDGINDWYYTMPVSGSTCKVTASDINVASDVIAEDPDLSKCKIWIEKAGADGLTYAKNALIEIKTADIAVTAPKGGEPFGSTAACNNTGVGSLSVVDWQPAIAKALYGTNYTATVKVAPAAGYGFSPDTVMTMNGLPVTSVKETDGSVSITGTFSTAKAKLLSITKPESVIGVGNGAEKNVEGLKLPKTVKVSVEDELITEADVSWDVAGCSYSKNKKTAQKFTVTGTVAIPDTYDLNNISTTISISVSVLEKGVPAKDTEIKDAKNQAKYKITKAGKIGGTVEYTKPVKKTTTVTIPDTITVDGIKYKVTSIAKNAFKNNKKITKVTIGKYVKTIGANAFYKCIKLKTVTLGKSVATIGDKAFYKCAALTKITLPSKVAKIGKQAFYGCKKLKTITVKTKKLTSKKMGKQAFKGIYVKATIKVPKSKYKSYKTLFKKAGVGKKTVYKKI